MRLVYGSDLAVATFVASLIPACNERGFSDGYRAIGIADGDQLIGGVVYHNWSPEAGIIECSCAATSKRWLTRPILYGIFSYAFGIGCQMVCSRVSERDHSLAKVLTAYGFKSVRVPRLLGREEDAIIFTLTFEDWRSNGFHKENENVEAAAPQAA